MVKIEVHLAPRASGSGIGSGNRSRSDPLMRRSTFSQRRAQTSVLQAWNEAVARARAISPEQSSRLEPNKENITAALYLWFSRLGRAEAIAFLTEQFAALKAYIRLSAHLGRIISAFPSLWLDGLSR
jgi:hypothetical protein